VCEAVRILPSYILRLHLVPFLLGFGVVTFVFEMDVLFDYLDLVINRGVPAPAVLQLFVLSLGFVIALSVPCAVLIATLMTFGRLSQDNEITALRASGVHVFRAMLPPLGAAGVLAVGLVLFNNYVYPDANHAFASLLVDIGRMRPTVKLQEGVFITDFPGYNLLVQSVNGSTNEMRGVTIYQLHAGSPPTTILAKRGFLTYTPDGKTAILELEDGEIHEIPAGEDGPSRYHRLQFRKHTINIQGAGGMLERTVRSARGDREKSAAQLISERKDVLADYERSLASHRQRFIDVRRAEGSSFRPSPRARAAGGAFRQCGCTQSSAQRPARRRREGVSGAQARRQPVDHGRNALRQAAGLSVEVHEVRVAGGLRRVRVDRCADRHARPPGGAGGRVPVHRLLPVLLRVPDRRRGTGQPSAGPAVVRDVDREPGAGCGRPGPDGAGVRGAAAVVPPPPQGLRGLRGRGLAMKAGA
jgi:hypothetical protein